MLCEAGDECDSDMTCDSCDRCVDSPAVPCDSCEAGDPCDDVRDSCEGDIPRSSFKISWSDGKLSGPPSVR